MSANARRILAVAMQVVCTIAVAQETKSIAWTVAAFAFMEFLTAIRAPE